jgi:HigB_toxin, RelE-like toxic component of a toxin-antitoxin system
VHAPLGDPRPPPLDLRARKRSAVAPVVAVNYRAHLVFIKFFGTHAEYNRIDVEAVKL